MKSASSALRMTPKIRPINGCFPSSSEGIIVNQDCISIMPDYDSDIGVTDLWELSCKI